MSFTITAELPLGTYRGARADGRPEPLPSVTRLHSALLCAAGFGPRAVVRDDNLDPCEADQAALRWLEENPPDAVAIPRLEVNASRAVAYRDDGTIKLARGRGTTKKLPKAPDAAVAVDGRFAWTWSDPPPSHIRDALAALCADVPYLGTTESPVRLTADADPPKSTHDLDRDAGLFPPPGAKDIDACLPGRTAELGTAHARRTTAPRAARTPYGTDEWSRSDVPPREAVATHRYVLRGAPPVEVPWSRVMLLPLSRAVPERYRVGWAVAAHRALIRILGEDAPPLLTGAYPADAPRPANRLALQLLDRSAPVADGFPTPGALAILFPEGAAASDVELIAQAVRDLRSVRGPSGRIAWVVDSVRELPGAEFWRSPDAGQVRLWQTTPAAVPDTRGSRADQWTFAQAAMLSIGFVWKAQLPSVRGRRDDYYRNLAQAVADAGVAVVGTRPLRTADVGRYAHRVHEHAVVRPYAACLWLGSLAPATAVAAIGQSRHLGGGLLMPHDVPEGTPAAEVVAGLGGDHGA